MSKHKNKTKTVVGVTVGVAVLVAAIGVAGWLTKGFQSTDVLDVTKKGTVVAAYDDLGKLYEDTGIYLDRYGDQTTMLGSETVYQQTREQNEIMSDEAWSLINIDGITNTRTIMGGALVRTVADLEDETAIGYFDTLRINYKANTSYYFLATGGGEVIAEKKSTNTYVADFFEIPLTQMEFEEEAAVGDMLGSDFDVAIFGQKGGVPSLQFQSIEFVNKSGLNPDVKLIVSGD